MRAAVVVLAALSLPAQTRHGVEADLKTFPQATPQEALASVIRAVEQKRIDYLLAQLADPAFVDARAKTEAAGFAALVQEATDKLVNDPGALKQLKRLAAEGEWQADDDSARVRLKDDAERSVSFRKAEGRWVMRNQYRPPAIKKRRG